MNQQERLAAIRELYPTHDALKRRVRDFERVLANTIEYARQTMPPAEFAEAMALVRSTPSGGAADG